MRAAFGVLVLASTSVAWPGDRLAARRPAKWSSAVGRGATKKTDQAHAELRFGSRALLNVGGSTPTGGGINRHVNQSKDKLKKKGKKAWGSPNQKQQEPPPPFPTPPKDGGGPDDPHPTPPPDFLDDKFFQQEMECNKIGDDSGSEADCHNAGCAYLDGCGLFSVCVSTHGMACDVFNMFSGGVEFTCDQSKLTGCAAPSSQTDCVATSDGDLPCFWLEMGATSGCISAPDSAFMDGTCPPSLPDGEGPPVDLTCHDGEGNSVTYTGEGGDLEDELEPGEECFLKCSESQCLATPGCSSVSMTPGDCPMDSSDFSGPSGDDDFGMFESVCAPQDPLSNCEVDGLLTNVFTDLAYECMLAFAPDQEQCELPSVDVTCGPDGQKFGCAQFNTRASCVAASFTEEAYYEFMMDHQDDGPGDSFDDGGGGGDGPPPPPRPDGGNGGGFGGGGGKVISCSWLEASIDGQSYSFCENLEEDSCEDAMDDEFVPFAATCYDDATGGGVSVSPPSTLDEQCAMLFDSESDSRREREDEFDGPLDCFGCHCYADEFQCLSDRCVWMGAKDAAGNDPLADLPPDQGLRRCEVPMHLPCNTFRSLLQGVSHPNYQGPDKIDRCPLSQSLTQDCYPEEWDLTVQCPYEEELFLDRCQAYMMSGRSGKGGCLGDSDCVFFELTDSHLTDVNMCVESFGASCQQVASFQDMGPFNFQCTDNDGSVHSFEARLDGGDEFRLDLGPPPEESIDDFDEFYGESKCAKLTEAAYTAMNKRTDGYTSSNILQVIQEETGTLAMNCLSDAAGCGLFEEGNCMNGASVEECGIVACVPLDYPCDVWKAMQTMDVDTREDTDATPPPEGTPMGFTVDCNNDPEEMYGCARHTTEDGEAGCLTDPQHQCLWVTATALPRWICVDAPPTCKSLEEIFVTAPAGFDCHEFEGKKQGNDRIPPGQSVQPKTNTGPNFFSVEFLLNLSQAPTAADVQQFVQDFAQLLSDETSIPRDILKVVEVVVNGVRMQFSSGGGNGPSRRLLQTDEVKVVVAVSKHGDATAEDQAQTMIDHNYGNASGHLANANAVLRGAGLKGVDRDMAQNAPSGAVCEEGQWAECQKTDIDPCSDGETPGLGANGCCASCRVVKKCVRKPCRLFLNGECIRECEPGELPEKMNDGCPSCFEGLVEECDAEASGSCPATSGLGVCGAGVEPQRNGECCFTCKPPSLACNENTRSQCETRMEQPTFPVCTTQDLFSGVFDQDTCCVTCNLPTTATPPTTPDKRCTEAEFEQCKLDTPVCGALEWPLHVPDQRCCPTCIPSQMLFSADERVKCIANSPFCASDEEPFTPENHACLSCRPRPTCATPCADNQVCTVESFNVAGSLNFNCRDKGVQTFKMCATTPEQKARLLESTPEEMAIYIGTLVEEFCEISSENSRCQNLDYTSFEVEMAEHVDSTEEVPCMEVSVVYGEDTTAPNRRRLLQSTGSNGLVIQDALQDDQVSEYDTITTTATSSTALDELATTINTNAATLASASMWAALLTVALAAAQA